MLYILSGDNTYSRHQFLADIKREMGEPELLEANTTLLAGAALTPQQLASAVNIAPFLASHRLVIVEGLLARFEPRRPAEQAPSPGAVQAFAAAAQPGAPAITLVLVEDKVSDKNPLFKALAPVAQVKPFPRLRAEELRRWIREQVTQRGGAIVPGAVSRLAEMAGDDLWSLSNEIDKLWLYSQGQPIQESHIQTVVARAREDNIFHLVDALLQRRWAVANRWLHDLLAQGMSPTRLLGLVAGQLRLIVLAQELHAQRAPERLSEREMQQRLGVADFVFRRTQAQARRYTLSQLVRAYQLLLDTDLAIKTGRQDDQVALEVLVAELAGKG